MTPVADTTGGKLQGREKNGVLLFAGIPYAAPPVGDRRFRAPTPVEPWGDVREAQRFSKVAPQEERGLGGVLAGRAPDWSEDCLYLNVQTPALDDARRPVMVWLHGGAFVGGTGATPWYDGARFVTHGDVVAVTLNYRLGAFGYLHLDDLDPSRAGSGNCGLLDQIAALEWVRDNIAAFGGDPDNVTLYGESAGAMSVATILGTPRARGLFHRAIAQSGAAHHVTEADVAREVREAVFERLGVHDVEALVAVPAGDLLEAQATVHTELVRDRTRGRRRGLALPFAPVVDGEVLPRPPMQAVADGLNADVPLLTGTTRDEWSLFEIASPPLEDEAKLLRRVERLLAHYPSAPDAPEVVAIYRRELGEAPPAQVWIAMMTDRQFRIPAIRLAEAQSQHQPEHTFLYRFDWATPVFDGRLASCHALEIAFVFDNLDKAGVAMLTGGEAPQSVADDMHQAWLAFVQGDDPNVERLPSWAPYDPDGARSTMVFDTTTHVEDDPGAETRRLWEGLL